MTEKAVKKSKSIVRCLFWAFVCVLIFGKSYIDEGVFIPKERVEIVVIGKNANSFAHEVWITDISGIDLKTAYEGAKEKEHFEYRDAATYGYSNDVIVNDASEESRIVFEFSSGEGNDITFWRQNLSAKVKIVTKYGEDMLDLYSIDSDDYVTIEVLSTEASIRHMGIKIAAFLVMWVASFVIVAVIYALRHKLYFIVTKFVEYMKHGKYNKAVGLVLVVMYFALLIFLYWSERN